MKKISKILFSAIALIVSAFTLSGNNNNPGLHAIEETPTNEVGGKMAIKLAQIDTEEDFSVSKTYVQDGEDGEGNKYIRFITAVKGNIKGLQYVRICKDLEEAQQIATKNVTTIYKGVVEEGETKYFNGTDFDTNPDTEYYFACYQIKIKAESVETYKHHRWEVSLQVDTDDDITTIEYKTDSRTGILEKITPEITFNNSEPGSHFYSTDLDWMYNVPNDADYYVTYSCGDKGIYGATTPENNGSGWSQTVTIIENDIYNSTSNFSNWFWYEGESNIEIRGFQYEATASSVAANSNRNNAMDGDPNTYLWVLYPQKEDAYLEWTLNEPVELKNIEVLLGKSEGGDEFWSTLSVSADKNTYTTIGNVDEREKLFNTSSLNLTGIKYIRLTNNNCVGTWAAVREIIINADNVEEEIKLFSNVTYGGFVGVYEGEITNLYDNNPDTFVRFTKPADETTTRYVQFELTNATDLYAIEILNGDNTFGDLFDGHIEVSSNGEDYEKFGNSFSQENVVAVSGDARAIKFIKVISNNFDNNLMFIHK